MVRKILSDSQWKRIEPLLSGKKSDCGVTAKDNRLFVEALLWIARTGSPWRDMPKDFGPWMQIYVRYNRWAKRGIWKHAFEVLSDEPDLAQLMIDGSIVRVHQQGASKKTSVNRKPKAVRVAV